MSLKVLELFGGIGACTTALKRLGVDYKVVDYVEIDKYAVASYNAINGTNFEPQDITTWNKDIEVDLIMHGSPCQDFSLAGKQAGGDEGSGTRSSLMYETLRIVNKLKPKYVIWENVKNLISKKHKHNFDKYVDIMNEGGYETYYQVLNSKDYGIPQNRERVFTISIRNDIDKGYEFPLKQELKLRLKDLLEDEVDEKYYLSEKMQRRCDASNYISKELGQNFNIKIKNATKQGYLEAEEGDGIDISSRMKYHRGTVQKQSVQTLDTQANQGVLENDLRIRKLTPKECWRLMGFNDEEFEKAEAVNSNTQLYKQAGNSIVVNVLEGILNNLITNNYKKKI
jgi:DNA (cytosine-5)-methyltransferase 1